MDPVLNKNAERLIWIAEPFLGGREEQYLTNTVKNNWISQGERVAEFENLVAQTCNKKYGSACNSGTTALHLALHVADVKEGDEVVIPNLTMIALANAVLLTGATPVFADSDKYSEVGNVSLETIKEKVTDKTKAVIVVHTYGEPVVDISAIQRYCREKGIVLIEDCAESHFALIEGKPVGSFGDLAILSFYSNKNITTGEGGMVVTNLAQVKIRLDRVRMHAFTPGKHFCHTERAFGYRMTDMQASIGLAQLESADFFMNRRRLYRSLYEAYMTNEYLRIARRSVSIGDSGVWVLPILAGSLEDRDNARKYFADHGIDSRTYFQPMHEQVFLSKYNRDNDTYPVSSKLGNNGFYLPLYPKMSESDVEYIAQIFGGFLGKTRV